MGDRRAKHKVLGVCVAAASGAVLAAAAASAQGPGDYQPTTTTPTTTTLPAPPDSRVSFRAKARSQLLDGHVEVKAQCDEDCFVTGRGRLRLTRIPGKGGKVPARSKGSRSYPLGLDSAAIDAGDTKTLRLAVSKKAVRAARRSKRYGGRVRARTTVNALDVAGNTGQERLRTKIRR